MFFYYKKIHQLSEYFLKSGVLLQHVLLQSIRAPVKDLKDSTTQEKKTIEKRKRHFRNGRFALLFL